VTLASNLKSKEKINILALDHRTGNREPFGGRPGSFVKRGKDIDLKGK